MAFVEDSLLVQGGGITHHGADVTEDFHFAWKFRCPDMATTDPGWPTTSSQATMRELNSGPAH